MKKKRDRIINAILFVLLILSIGIILYLTKSDVLKPKEEVIPEVKPNSGFEVFEVENLQSKINKLSFVNKKQDFYNKSTKVNVNTNITSGKVTITIKFDKIKKSYVIDNIDNAICVHTNVSNTTHTTYILTEDEKVYKVEDDLPTVKTTDNYKGEAVDLGLVNVIKIAVDKTLKFKINSELKKVVPCVYIKTDDDRVFTDEAIIEGKQIVELVEKKKEINENASNNN